MRTFYTFTFMLLAFISNAQQTISGTVVDEKNKPVVGANVFIDGTYDGASTDEKGNFNFQTTASGNQTLVISFLTFETLKMPIDANNCKDKMVKLKESVNTLDAVICINGHFQSFKSQEANY